MRFAIASDIHGSAYWCEKLLTAFEQRRCDHLILLGDLLYHGPRNVMPRGYNPKATADLLNEYASRILAVRGNCDAEVDQAMLDFPCLAEYALVNSEATMLCTHGHKFGPGLHNSAENMPKLAPGNALLFGHTHIKAYEANWNNTGITVFNPGSVAIPKDSGNSFGIFDNGSFSHVALS